MQVFVSSKLLQGRRGFANLCILLLFLVIASSFTHCDARRSIQFTSSARHASNAILEHIKKLKVTKHFDIASLLVEKETMQSSNTEPYVSSPFTLPPYDSLPPVPLPQNAPPYCIYPPNTPQPPTTTSTSPPPPPFYYLPPVFPLPNPPPSPTGVVPSPPVILVPSPPFYEPSPPSYVPNPPSFVPSPTVVIPSPPVFKPPIVFPPPTVPPTPRTGPSSALWCVAKPSVPEPIVQEAMNYACGSGADCDSIQPSGTCFEPNTVYAHASFAFNSYWQRTKVAGGTCSFGGAAILVTVDPSYDGCHFPYA